MSSINSYVACETRWCPTETNNTYCVVECAVETVENARFEFLPFVSQPSVINSSAPCEVNITAVDLTNGLKKSRGQL